MIKKITLALLAIVVLAGAGGYVYIGQLEQQSAEATEQLNSRVTKIRAVVAKKVKQWRETVNELANSETLIASFGEIDEQARIDAWLEAQANSNADMTMLRVLRPGLMNVDMSSNPPLGFAGLELVRKAESSKKASNLEVHMLGSDKAHIALAAPVLKGDQVVAVILSSLDVNAIQKAFKSVVANEQGAWLLLKQGSLVMGTGGGKAHLSGSVLNTGAVAGTSWKIVIKRLPDEIPVSKADVLTYVIALVLLILLVGGLAIVFSDKEKRSQLGAVLNKRSDAKKAKHAKQVEEGFVAGKESAESVGTDEKTNEQANLIRERVQQAAEDSEGEEPKQEEQTVSFTESAPLSDGVEEGLKEDVPQSIFRAYDIRGIVDETLTEAGVNLIGRAIATEALHQGQQVIAIARDGRLHSQRLSEALANGIQSTGCDVIDVGQVPTPVLYFATHNLATQSGVMITGSHNPANYNGLKIVIDGNTLSGDAIQALYQRIEKDDFTRGEGNYQEQMMLPEYIGEITSDVRMGRMMKVVVDCGNGVAGEAAPMLLATLGCDIVQLHCEIDGNFPNHHPDPSKPENLQELIEKVRDEEAELGLAFDGDGDRLGVVDSEGNIIWPDRQMMLYAKDVLSRQAGADILYDVKCTRNLAKVIAKHGGKPIMSKTGHSLIKAKMKETKAELAGEMSGHIFFKERWYGFDDALYTAARLLEIISAEFRASAEIFAEFPDSVSTPELNITMQEGENFSFVEQFQAQAQFDDAKIITIDGLRVEFKDGWGLVRASNTTPSLVMRFEADDELALEKIKQLFKEQMMKIDPTIELTF